MNKENGHPKYCLKCLAKMAIRCAWCGRAIFVGDPITLYAGTKRWRKVNIFPQLSDPALEKKRDEKMVVGCLRTDCAESGGDRAGFLEPEGKIYRVMTAFEMLLNGKTDHGDDCLDHEIVLIRDICDPVEAIPSP
jgi:hypothetical protein